MERLPFHEMTMMFLALETLLATARILGEVAKRWHQPVAIAADITRIFRQADVRKRALEEAKGSLTLPGHYLKVAIACWRGLRSLRLGSRRGYGAMYVSVISFACTSTTARPPFCRAPNRIASASGSLTVF
jgi:hypothetical protein